MARSAWRLSGYTVETLLGSGSSGEVWRARVHATGAAVAVKRIPLGDGPQRRAASAEAAMLAALDHPHLVALHDVRQVDESLVLVLDLADGGSLADLLAVRDRLTPGEVITALAPIGAALAYAHRHEVVHGDVSAANVLFTGIGLPLLADLGVARLLGDRAPARTTPAYADPAVVAGGVPGPATDVFMLGAVALHALTGSPPWPGDDAAALSAAAAGTAPDFAARLAAAGTPDPIAAPVLRALRLDPLERGTAADFALDLRHAGRPVAVELAAGRRRPVPAPGAPNALRTAGGSFAPGRPPLTVGVRAPSPLPDTATRRALHRRQRRRRALGRTLAGVAAAVAGVALVVGRAGLTHRAGASAGDTAAAARPPSAATSATGATTSHDPVTSPSPDESPTPDESVAPAAAEAPRSSSSSAGTAGAPATDPAQLLDRLDALRARAYAGRDPQLLRRVYASPGLLARDQAQLRALVPAGCGLDGVRTRFTAVRRVDDAGTTGPDAGRADASRMQLRVRAALTPSTLRCHGTPAGTAAGSRPVELDIELVRTADGYRISRQRSAA